VTDHMHTYIHTYTHTHIYIFAMQSLASTVTNNPAVTFFSHN
jgi:hypothetical protein